MGGAAFICDVNEEPMYHFAVLVIDEMSMDLQRALTTYIYCHRMVVIQLQQEAIIEAVFGTSLTVDGEVASCARSLGKHIQLHRESIKHIQIEFADLVGPDANV